MTVSSAGPATRAIRPGARSAAVTAAGVLTVASLGYVGLRDPRSAAVMPRCPFHWVSGLNCPGCGGLRMTHDLLHGDVAAAFADNAVLLVLAPLLVFLLVRGTVRWLRGDPMVRGGRFEVRGTLGVTLAVVGVVWGIVRNLG